MIVVSGVLVLVALVFLIIGLLQNSGLGFIWASIITSVIAGAFLLLGALQRRGAPAVAADQGATSGEMLDRVTAVSVRPRDADDEAPPAVVAQQQVAVVRGRPRYHVDGCRFLAGRPDVEHLGVDDARGEGFTPCGVCKPDTALAAAEEPAAPDTAAFEAPVADELPVLDEEIAPPEPPARAPRKAAAKPAKATSRTAAASSRTATATDAPAKAPAKAPAAGQVVVIPDRGKFHTETCRFVRDVAGTVTLSKAAAKRQGYSPCGVCKP